MKIYRAQTILIMMRIWVSEQGMFVHSLKAAWNISSAFSDGAVGSV